MSARTSNAYLGIIIACLIGALLIVVFAPRIEAAEAAQAPEPENCVKGASAEGEALYLCNVDGVMCVWDPSPSAQTGILDCEE